MLPTGVMLWREILERWQGWQSRAQSAAVFLDGWPHEALGDELSRCPNSGMAERM
jgi:hypothetical protein